MNDENKCLFPDYLIDISSLAECFRAYGHHPFNFFLSRLLPKADSAAILLGNTANFFIDEWINADDTEGVQYETSLKKLFQIATFEFTACDDLKNPRAEHEFFAACRKHYENIRQTVAQCFPQAGINKSKIILEPSFISNVLGLQGRLDMLASDYSALIELKSGKAMEDFRSGGQFIHAAANHYIQMILYGAILEQNLQLDAEKINSYLLYSKYPLLSKERFSRESLQEAMQLRNQIVEWEYAIQKENNAAYTRSFLEQITAETLNTQRLTGDFYERYLRPPIDRFQIAFAIMNETEKTYFARLYTFITKELWLSKAGEREYEGVKKPSILWNASFADMLVAGELLYDLKITDNQAAAETHTMTLEIPEYKDLYLPNFRPGDAIVLYERNNEKDTVGNRQVFKGSIEVLEAQQLKIRLRYRQKNPDVWNVNARYAVMHDSMDTTYHGMFKGLTCFMQANRERRALLLGRRKPEKGEVFLLVGPPGTGKTSRALKQMVENELQTNRTNILLLSYTNRAVDEICHTLKTISERLPFIRIGSELNCDPEFRPYLLENQLKSCTNRSDVAYVIEHCRIFVGTVASVWNKPGLFHLKCFDLAIIDEATQLLEPQLLGILSVCTPAGDQAIRRWVMVGDHKQLPAVVLQSREESRVIEPELTEIGLTNLSDSLFERLFRSYQAAGIDYACDFLVKQGRMHPEIAAFPSSHFYGGRLESAGLPHQLEMNYPWQRLCFYDIKPSGNDLSEKTNRNEAEKVVAICRELQTYYQERGEVFDFRTLGIITPFRNQ
ncbi:MAG: AAA family ATPase, partial [Dysgonamonadaceae bacterium]|nr:AAA family ATPase [Dysgonamonadaceae bacterium]